MTTSRKKRMHLLSYAKHGLELKEVNHNLVKGCMDPVSYLDWNLWVNHYLPIVDDNPYFERELVDHNRSLAWFARRMNERKRKINLS